jgi:hypothetical protein
MNPGSQHEQNKSQGFRDSASDAGGSSAMFNSFMMGNNFQ